MLFGTLEKHEKCLHGKQIAVTRRRRPPPAAYAFSADMVKIKQQHLHHAPFLFGQRFFLSFMFELDSNCHLRLKIAMALDCGMCHVTFSEFQSTEIYQQLEVAPVFDGKQHTDIRVV